MRNPIRRSKKIGLTQGGRVKDGYPVEKFSRLFSKSTWEILSESIDQLRIIRENPSRDYFHPCSASQIRSVIEQLPAELTKDIKVVVLRRKPKVDEYNCIEAWKRYECIILNSFPRDLRMVWNYKPKQTVLRYMNRWCNRWKEEDGLWVLQWTFAEIRKYYLYSLLLHEIGHFNGWYSSKKRHEDFAENFALEWAKKLGELPNIPQ